MPALKAFGTWWAEIYQGVSTTLKGMAATGKYWAARGSEATGKSHFLNEAANTRRLYPDVDRAAYQREVFPERFRGDLHNDAGLCIGCFQCQKACPVDCFWIEVEVSKTKKKRISRFDIDLGRCIYCHLCVDACPEDGETGRKSLSMTREFEFSSFVYLDQVRSFGEGFFTPPERAEVAAHREAEKARKAAERAAKKKPDPAPES